MASGHGSSPARSTTSAPAAFTSCPSAPSCSRTWPTTPSTPSSWSRTLRSRTEDHQAAGSALDGHLERGARRAEVAGACLVDAEGDPKRRPPLRQGGAELDPGAQPQAGAPLRHPANAVPALQLDEAAREGVAGEYACDEPARPEARERDPRTHRDRDGRRQPVAPAHLIGRRDPRTGEVLPRTVRAGEDCRDRAQRAFTVRLREHDNVL